MDIDREASEFQDAEAMDPVTELQRLMAALRTETRRPQTRIRPPCPRPPASRPSPPPASTTAVPEPAFQPLGPSLQQLIAARFAGEIVTAGQHRRAIAAASTRAGAAAPGTSCRRRDLKFRSAQTVRTLLSRLPSDPPPPPAPPAAGTSNVNTRPRE